MAKKILLVLWVVSVLVISHANIKTMKKILACLLLCLMMTGCEYDNTIKGWCVGKEHKPAYSIVQHCPTRRVVYPETWNLWVADSVIVRHICVSEQTYNNVSKGEYVRLKH